jgi:hypothetical protein
MTVHRVKTTHCPSCNKEYTKASSVNSENPPMPGDVTMCIQCREILVFTYDMNLKKATEAEKKLFYSTFLKSFE